MDQDTAKSESNKRFLTESMREIAAATDPSPLGSDAEKELAFSLRCVGARVRQSIYQGYQTPPGSCAKTQSTGSLIFRSMNDTLCDVQGGPSLLSSSFDSSRKRSLSPDCDDERKTTSDVLPCPHASITTRPTKPLRKTNHVFFRTHSSPTSLPLPKHLHDIPTHCTEFEEEDWSNAQGSADQLFTPMNL